MEILDGSRNLTQQLTYELGKAIVQEKYVAEAAFPTEADLSSQFNISRSVTREAVKMLTAKGLISSRPRKGIRVQPASSWNMFDTDVLNWMLSAKPSLKLLREFVQLRLAIEPESVALAAISASQDQIFALAESLERIDQVRFGEDSLLSAEIQFRTRVLECSNNRFFSQFSGFIQGAMRIASACTPLLNSKLLPSPLDYSALYLCVLDRQPEEGRELMRLSLIETMSIIDQSMASQDNNPGDNLTAESSSAQAIVI